METFFSALEKKKCLNRPIFANCFRFIYKNQSISRIIDQMSILILPLKKIAAFIKNGISPLSLSLFAPI